MLEIGAGNTDPRWFRQDVTRSVKTIDDKKVLESDVKRVRPIKVVVEKHSDGYIAYPLGLKGVVVGEGDTYEEALADVKSAITFHIETFGPDVLEAEPPEWRA
jgi:predicted RNase H-like HicB family nuclease